jgi:arsenate reductase
VEYLDNPVDEATLRSIMGKLPNPPADMVRKDRHFDGFGLNADDYTTEDQVVAVLLEHPILMQRPIAVVGDNAIIGRPPELVFEVVPA